ncbi:acyltransferase [Kribbella antibiotica]|uniref:Acyltransferase n=1 Tax=Kribbella antibiotica TaxID=190195 RepID=A0A4R4YHS0_9ACTN|nr:acyltransferase [Kribbella antibiotica]TDD44428.1 acyltransferase [Kribbella antibiotica]
MALPATGQPMCHTRYLALRRFPALDGLRAIAALMVVFAHNNGPHWLQGWIGVQLFFVVSGFLITTLMLREEDRSGQISFRDFYLRRVFRILPVYFVVLAATLLVQLGRGVLTTSTPGSELPLYLFFFNEFGHGGIYGQSWSLGIEQKFYLLWPLLAFATIIAQRRAKTGLRIGITIALMTLSIATVPLTLGGDPRGWPAHYFSILIGCLVGILFHHPKGFALFRPLTRPWVASAAVVLFVGAHLSISVTANFIDRHDVFGDIPHLLPITPLYAVLVALLLLPALLADALPQRLLSFKPMVYLGERSYSIYLVHNLARLLADYLCKLVGLDITKGPLIFFVTATLAVGMAHFCYRWVELPMIEAGRRVIRRRKNDQVLAA